MRCAIALLLAVAALPGGTALAAAPARGEVFCWEFDLDGTDAPDALEGTAAADHAAGYGGTDRFVLFGGDDCATGGADHDELHLGPGNDGGRGGGGADEISGGPGDDILLAGLGADDVDGGEGDDHIRDERGDADHDVLVGGPGHDVIRAANAAGDEVDCGPGWDVVIVDSADTLSGCDDVRMARRPNVTARTVRMGARPAFEVTWKVGDLATPAQMDTLLVRHPAVRPGCAIGSWRARGSHDIRLGWSSVVRACPGRYVFRVVHEARTRIACEVLAGSPRAGCRRAEVLGEIELDVR